VSTWGEPALPYLGLRELGAQALLVDVHGGGPDVERHGVGAALLEGRRRRARQVAQAQQLLRRRRVQRVRPYTVHLSSQPEQLLVTDATRQPSVSRRKYLRCSEKWRSVRPCQRALRDGVPVHQRGVHELVRSPVPSPRMLATSSTT